MTDLQLRKELCEALSIEPKVEWIASKDGGESSTLWSDYENVARDWCDRHPGYRPFPISRYPAIESDPGVFWPEFEKWHTAGWHMDKTVYGGYGHTADIRTDLAIHLTLMSMTSGGYRFEIRYVYGLVVQREFIGSGLNATEAGCRAWLAALKAMR